MNFWKPFLPYTGKISLLHWLVLYPFIVCSVRLALRKPWKKNTVLEAMVCVSVVCVCMNSSQNKGSRTYIPRWFIQTGAQNSIKKCTKEGISFNSWNPFATRWIRCKRKSLWFGVSAVAERPCPSSTCATISLTNLSHVHSPCNTGFGFFLTLTLETSTFLRILPCTFFCWAHM